MKNFVLSVLALILFVGLNAQDDQNVIIITKDKQGKWVKEEKALIKEMKEIKVDRFMNGSNVFIHDGDEYQDRLIAKKGYKAFLGVVVGHSFDDQGFTVSRVVENSGAKAGGLLRGDQVLNINGLETNGDHGLRGVLSQLSPGDQVTVNVLRDGQPVALNVTLGQRETTKWVLNDERNPCDVFIGVYTTTNSFDGEGVRITSIIGNTPAEESSLLAGDVILELNEASVNTSRELRIERDKNSPGDEFTLLIKRNDQVMDVLARFKTCDTENEIEELQEVEMEEDFDIEIEQAPQLAAPATTPLAEETEEEPFSRPLFNTVQPLELSSYEAYPNPSMGDINIKFQAEPVPTTIRLQDVNGKVIYNEQLNRFDGFYQKQLNLGTTPGTLLLSIQQADRVVTKKLVLLDRS